MYRFALHLIDMNTDREELFAIDVDETPIECNEKEIFLCAMSKAYDLTRSNDKYMFDSLEFISC